MAVRFLASAMISGIQMVQIGIYKLSVMGILSDNQVDNPKECSNFFWSKIVRVRLVVNKKKATEESTGVVQQQ